MTAADVEKAIADNRFYDARSGLLAWREYAGPSPENSQELAQVMLDLGDGHTAERYLNELRDAQGESPLWTTMRAQSLILQGQAWRARELLDEFEGAARDNGDHAWLRVWAAMEEAQIDEAQELLANGLGLYPQSARLHAKAARLAVWRGDWDTADQHVDEALRIDPDEYEAMLIGGEVRIAKGDLEGALLAYQTAGAAYPDFAIPQANIAGLMLDLGRTDAAEPVLERALRTHPDFALLRFNLARLHGLKGRWSTAREILLALPADWKRNFPAATLLEGEAEAALGNHAMAMTLYRSAAGDPRFEQKADELMALLPG
ncbi:tetratricopeptide repeat protein [Qipengyuania sp. ASV99]|uniref:tetratricopeptide repeat protein n=1 Tax=Qipengyuania sp. ASV99 TaxID=3399681 RepID=UPI003A4C63E3